MADKMDIVVDSASVAHGSLDAALHYSGRENNVRMALRQLGKDVAEAGKTFAKTAAPKTTGITAKASKDIAKTTEKVAAKILPKVAKGVGKSVLKKVPVVSLAVGGYFAIKEAKNGNWVRAAGELASGIAGCFPGAGTCISLGLDTAMMAYDVAEIRNENKKAESGKVGLAEFGKQSHDHNLKAQEYARMQQTNESTRVAVPQRVQTMQRAQPTAVNLSPRNQELSPAQKLQKVQDEAVAKQMRAVMEQRRSAGM